MTLNLRPAVLRWARERASLSEVALAERLKVSVGQVNGWERDGSLSFALLQKLANATRTPEGYLFLAEPPEEKLPVPDFRTVGGKAVSRHSPELLDVIHDAQRKQAWYREYLIASGIEPLGYVGSLNPGVSTEAAASTIRQTMGLDTKLRSKARDWEEALRLQIEQIESHGILVLRNGVVASNTKRKLNVAEFRGFALADPIAPLIFLNSTDAPAALMFTLAHELVHVWLGVSGVSNPAETYANHDETERFCNQVAAELLVPASELRTVLARFSKDTNPVPPLCRHFRVSSLVMLRRLRDVGELDWETFRKLYREEELKFARKREKAEGGGDFYRTELARVSPRLAYALVESAVEGRTPYKDACELLGVASAETVNKMARRFEFIR